MSDSFGVFLTSLFMIGLVFVACILGAVLGAFSGLIVGFIPFLGDWIKSAFLSFGYTVDLVQVGAMFGFIGGFFIGGKKVE